MELVYIWRCRYVFWSDRKLVSITGSMLLLEYYTRRKRKTEVILSATKLASYGRSPFTISWGIKVKYISVH